MRKIPILAEDSNKDKKKVLDLKRPKTLEDVELPMFERATKEAGEFVHTHPRQKPPRDDLRKLKVLEDPDLELEDEKEVDEDLQID
jgi:hypothetical protein